MSEPKQMLVIRKDLNMRKGKIASQAAHASLKALLNYAHWEPNNCLRLILMEKPVIEWLKGNFTKVCVSVDSEEELDDLYSLAKFRNIPCSMIIDNGFTEFRGIPTKTAVAIGPWYPDVINKLTGNLKLL